MVSEVTALHTVSDGSGCGSVGLSGCFQFQVRGSNPVIGKKIKMNFTVNCIEKTKLKKEAGNGPFLERV